MLSRKQAIMLGIASTFFLVAFVLMLPEIQLRFPLMQNRGESSGEQEIYRIARVVDGDTVELGNGRKVRYIGINTPETVDPRRQVECFGKEASAFNASLVEGKTVRLERDVSETDKYGRLLRFVYLEDGTFINEVLVREGYAYASAYTPDVSRKELFLEAEKDARENHRGLWALETCDGKKESVR